MKKEKRPVKITFLGAGSTIFARNILGDCMRTEALRDCEIALYDIDPVRLRESKLILETLNSNINSGRSKIIPYLGKGERRNALKKAKYVVNSIQVGGYKPSTVIDFEIPKKYGLRQTIADTLGIGGIFRSLRTIPVVFDFAKDMEVVCPDAWFLNYTNPMAMITSALLRNTHVKTVGLCHSVQSCVPSLLNTLDLGHRVKNCRWKIAGINHQAWLLELKENGRDFYPEIKRRAFKILEKEKRKGNSRFWDLVRYEVMRNFGYYVTESSEHTSEYVPWFIKSRFPGLIKEYNIPLDEYIRRCKLQIKQWKQTAGRLLHDRKLSHSRTTEYGSYIMEAMETNIPLSINGNIMNNGFITNLPGKACVEVPCRVNRKGIHGTFIGNLPQQCAALNRTNVNVQILAVEAAITLKKDYIYQAALLDPHTAGELSIDKIRNMCDDLIKAHGRYLPHYK